LGIKEERRSDPRADRGASQVQAAIPGSTIRHVDNISCSGVLCRMDRNLPLMEKLLVSIDLPGSDETGDARSLECEGVVVRTEPFVCENDGAEYQVAIFFTHLEDDARQHISEYVARDLVNG
jgi:hypothetical protein